MMVIKLVQFILSISKKKTMQPNTERDYEGV